VQLEQVLLNLVVNAAQAMQACAPEQRKLTIRTEAGKAEIRVSVIDSGEGVPAEQLNKIFEPFVSTKPEGLGIGLVICYSIIRAHGGRLTATNNPDRGATFCFALPIQA
jgi:signal transduction histidine kinase